MSPLQTTSRPSNPAAGNAHTPPAWKAGTFKKQPGAWSSFNEAVGRLPQVSEAERFTYGQIYAAEGGNAKDPASSASSGILQKTLDNARARVPGLDRAKTPNDLNAQQRAAIYRDYFDQALQTVGGHQALDRIGNKEAAAALADVFYRFGPSKGARIVQQAIERVAPGSIKTVDGRMGPETLAAITVLASNPEFLRQLLDMISAERSIASKGKERERDEYFRFLLDTP